MFSNALYYLFSSRVRITQEKNRQLVITRYAWGLLWNAIAGNLNSTIIFTCSVSMKANISQEINSQLLMKEPAWGWLSNAIAGS